MFLAMLAVAVAPVDPLEEAFSEAHRNYQAHSTDQFADSAISESFLGKQFRIVRPVHGLGSGELSGPYYSYDNGTFRLIFEPSPQPFFTKETPPPVLFTVGGSAKPQRTYPATNAFGAKFRVTVEQVRENAIEMLQRPHGVPDAAFAAIPELASQALESYTVEFRLAGAEARALATDAQLIIEGTITRLVGGGVNYCKPLDREATASETVEIHGEQCWIAANVSRIAFTRKSGEVLKEWLP